MNPASFFREALESHEFRLSDSDFSVFSDMSRSISFMSDNANLLDIVLIGRVRRFMHEFLGISAARHERDDITFG